MTKPEFRNLFTNALELAARNAESKGGLALPRLFEIEMHGLAPHVRVLTEDEAFDAIWLEEERFYRIIDLAVRRVKGDRTVIFMRVSGHPPGTLNETWDPSGSGPFKQLLAQHVEIP